MLRPMLASDWPQVARIYADGIATGHATFDDRVPTWSAWDASHRPDLRLIVHSGDQVIGWAAASPVSDRCCYQGVVEDSVYVDPRHHGLGAGQLLLSSLVKQAVATGVWTIQAGIFPENVASLRVHHACGFRTVGRRERLGQVSGVWRDVLLLEHRSP